MFNCKSCSGQIWVQNYDEKVVKHQEVKIPEIKQPEVKEEMIQARNCRL